LNRARFPGGRVDGRSELEHASLDMAQGPGAEQLALRADDGLSEQPRPKTRNPLSVDQRDGHRGIGRGNVGDHVAETTAGREVTRPTFKPEQIIGGGLGQQRRALPVVGSPARRTALLPDGAQVVPIERNPPLLVIRYACANAALASADLVIPDDFEVGPIGSPMKGEGSSLVQRFRAFRLRHWFLWKLAAARPG